MSGQPNIPGWLELDVTNLEATETGLAPAIIVKKSEPFDLSANFEGAGVIWTLLELISDLPVVEVVGKVTFAAEGIGADADEEDFGPAEAILTHGGSPYTATLTVPANSLDEGVYIVACRATFEVRAGGDVVQLPGVTGSWRGIGAAREDLTVYEP